MRPPKLDEIDIDVLQEHLDQLEVDIVLCKNAFKVAKHMSTDGKTLSVYAGNSLAIAREKLQGFASHLGLTLDELAERFETSKGASPSSG